MRRLVEGIGVDYHQWRTLVGMHWTIRWRPSKLLGSNAVPKQAAGVALTAIFYGMTGFLSALVIFAQPDVLLTATIALSYAGIIVASDVLSGQSGSLTAVDDYTIIGYRPVSSRTFFAVRFTNVLLQATLVTALSAWPAVLAYLMVRGPRPGLALVAAAAFWLSALFISLAFSFLYGYALRVINPQVVKRVLGYLQLIAGFVVFGGYFLVLQLAKVVDIGRFELPRTWWLLAWPPAWFASLLAVTNGESGPVVIALATAAVLGTTALAVATRNAASTNYLEHVALLMTSQPAARAKTKRLPGVWTLRHESYAAFTLIRAQLKHDMTFRMGVLGVIPMVAVYIIMGLRDGGGFTDPFYRWTSGDKFSMVDMGALMLPAVLWQPLLNSPSYAASWIYFATPADRGALVRGARWTVTMTIVLPYLLVLGVLLMYLSGSIVHVLVHIAMLGLIATVVLQVQACVTPGLPFADPPTATSRGAVTFILMMVLLAVTAAIVVALYGLVYPHWPRVIAAFAVLSGLSLLVERVSRALLNRRVAARMFAG